MVCQNCKAGMESTDQYCWRCGAPRRSAAEIEEKHRQKYGWLIYVLVCFIILLQVTIVWIVYQYWNGEIEVPLGYIESQLTELQETLDFTQQEQMRQAMEQIQQMLESRMSQEQPESQGQINGQEGNEIMQQQQDEMLRQQMQQEEMLRQQMQQDEILRQQMQQDEMLQQQMQMDQMIQQNMF